MIFKETLDLHLQSIASKDYDRFISTVCENKITLIMPNGSLITDYENFSKLHKSWFSDTDWSINYTLISTVETSEICTALLSINYSDCDENGNSISMTYYLHLIFEYMDSKWLLIHDQNTIFNQ